MFQILFNHLRRFNLNQSQLIWIQFNRCCSPSPGPSQIFHHHRCQFISTSSSTQCFAAKKDDIYRLELPPSDDDNNDGGGESQKPKPRAKTLDFKQKIYLKDINGRMLGLKTRQEAEMIAAKNRLILVEDDQTKKIPTFKLTNPKDKVKFDNIVDDSFDDESSDDSSSSSSSSSSDESSSSSSTTTTTNRHAKKQHHHTNVPKQLIFSAKLNEHDLQTKIRQVKRWLAKGQETIIKVQALGADMNKMRSIDTELNHIFNQPETFGTKINQHRLNNELLKMNIVPVDLVLAKKHGEQHHTTATTTEAVSSMDPNKLLNDTENVLKSFDSGSDGGSDSKA